MGGCWVQRKCAISATMPPLLGRVFGLHSHRRTTLPSSLNDFVELVMSKVRVTGLLISLSSHSHGWWGGVLRAASARRALTRLHKTIISRVWIAVKKKKRNKDPDFSCMKNYTCNTQKAICTKIQRNLILDVFGGHWWWPNLTLYQPSSHEYVVNGIFTWTDVAASFFSVETKNKVSLEGQTLVLF